MEYVLCYNQKKTVECYVCTYILTHIVI